MSTIPEPKYRPVLTAAQIDTILSLCKTIPLTPEKMQVIITLSPFQAKIQNGGITAAYITNPPEAIEDKLGFTNEFISTQMALTPQQKRAAAYQRYCANPTICTLEELKLVQTYRYENSLMNAEEKSQFESSGGE